MVSKQNKRAIFLDRDGVIIESDIWDGKPIAIRDQRNTKIIPGVIESLILLGDVGFELVVVTNQPDISTGKISLDEIDAIHAKISLETNLKHFYICPHVDTDFCKCRKPEPGLILSAARELSLDVSESFLIGDRWRDIEASHRAGCAAFFIDHSYSERKPSPPFTKVNSLLDASRIILESM